MTVRLLLGVAFVANIVVVVLCSAGVCPTNERYSSCIQAECRALNCTQKDQSVPCIRLDPKCCQKGCVCEEGYLRNEDGICVLEDKCEPRSCVSDNEEFVPCMQGVCRAKECSQKGEDVQCPDIPQEECDSGCICKEHFFRASNGSCVPQDQCEPNKCPRFEQWDDCANAVCTANFCYQRGLSLPCPSVSECIPGCLCQNNYLRDESGVCVPEEDCIQYPCPLNEVLSNCTQAVCRTQNCTDRGKVLDCPMVAEGDCEEGCVCKEGYLRVKNGLYCVPEDECDANRCQLFEVWDKCANAACRAENCTQKGLSVACPSVTECVPGCLCQPNYLRDAVGYCIPEENCNICPTNEEWSTCAQATCRNQKCSEKDELIFCPTIAEGSCIEACVCKENYLRNNSGDCVAKDQCPPLHCSAKPNEAFVACPPLCPTDECDKPRLEGRCPFRIGIGLKCNPKCQCKDGYGRVNGTCVPFEECPDLCPANETYSPCVQQTRCRENCSDRDLPMEMCPWYDEASCQRGCVCKDSYYRNDKGVCVSYEECGGPMCPNAYEEYTPNFKECPPNICKSLESRYTCDENQKEGPGCMCKPGYLRLSATSTCIPICDCPEMKDSPDC